MSEDRFKEILEELFDSKIEIIQMIDTIDKKLEKLILARNFDKSEQPKGMTVPQDYDPLQNPKKESKTKVTEQTIIKGAVVPGDFQEYFKDGVSKSWIVIDEERKLYAFVPKGFSHVARDKLMLLDWVIEKGEFNPKWKPFTNRFWEEKS